MLSVEPLLSKSHAQLVGPFVLVSVNCTVSGAPPVFGVAVNDAVGEITDPSVYR